MGTRNLTCVFLDGEYKVAQYGQWDGYPDGQGLTALTFLRNVNHDYFKDAVRACTFIDEEERDKRYKEKEPLSIKTNSYQLSRDHGATILWLVAGRINELYNEIDFAKDSVMCEWCYVIDFDTNTFEIYKGFREEPNSPENRFQVEEPYIGYNETKYYAVELKNSYPLDALPNNEQFLEDLICKEE